MAALAFALSLSVAPPSASAQDSPRSAKGRYNTPPTPYEDSGTYDPECEGLGLSVAFEVSGVYSDRKLRGSGGQAFLLKDRYRFREVWTNTATGKVLFTWRGKYTFQEVSGHRVPKSRVPAELIPEGGLVGPIYRFTSVEVGHDTIRSPRGKTLYRTAGVLVFKSLFDTLGDFTPGGTQLSSEIVKVKGPHPLLDVDICEVAAEEAA